MGNYATDSKYILEVFDSAGKLVAEFSGRADNREIHLARNRSGYARWTIGLDELEDLARKLGVHPLSILSLNSSEMRVRRSGRYLFGGQINYVQTIIEPDKREVEVRAVGFLDLFDSRFVSNRAFTSLTDAGTIAWTLINESQLQVNGNFGITQGTITASANRTITYDELKNIKEAIIQLSEAYQGFDFEISYDKKFNVFYPQGTKKDDLQFVYPGNIKKFKLPRDGTLMVNQAIVRGSYEGNDQKSVTRDDTDSQTSYKLRQRVFDYPSVKEESTLNDHGDEKLRLFKEPHFEIPQIVLDGNREPFVGSYWLGDQIKLSITGVDMARDIANVYLKIDGIDVSINTDDSEEVTLSLSKA